VFKRICDISYGRDNRTFKPKRQSSKPLSLSYRYPQVQLDFIVDRNDM